MSGFVDYRTAEQIGSVGKRQVLQREIRFGNKDDGSSRRSAADRNPAADRTDDAECASRSKRCEDRARNREHDRIVAAPCQTPVLYRLIVGRSDRVFQSAQRCGIAAAVERVDGDLRGPCQPRHRQQQNRQRNCREPEAPI